MFLYGICSHKVCCGYIQILLYHFTPQNLYDIAVMIIKHCCCVLYFKTDSINDLFASARREITFCSKNGKHCKCVRFENSINNISSWHRKIRCSFILECFCKFLSLEKEILLYSSHTFKLLMSWVPHAFE